MKNKEKTLILVSINMTSKLAEHLVFENKPIKINEWNIFD